jgi:hypothetical protein
VWVGYKVRGALHGWRSGLGVGYRGGGRGEGVFYLFVCRTVVSG